MAALIAAAVAFGWCAVAIKIGPLLGFIDQPDDTGLKPHARPAIPLGGVGVFLGIHIALALSRSFDTSLLIASGLVLVLGLIDDRHPLSPLLRLGVEAAAGVVIGLRFFDGIGIVGATVLVVVAINAVNLFDGLDGLAGAATVVTGFGLAWLGTVRATDPAFGLALAGAALGFLLLNWHPAKVFLGDNGSYVIGVFLVFGMIEPAPSLERLGPNLLLMGVFGLDLGATVLRRRLTGHPMFAGDRNHTYDQLHANGVSIRAVAMVAATVQMLFVIAAETISRTVRGVASWVLALIVGLVVLAGVTVVVARQSRPTPPSPPPDSSR